MAFLKYANARMVSPDVGETEWGIVRKGSNNQSFSSRKASAVFRDYNPQEYLLSHVTIVASVDVENGPGPLGPQLVDGFQIDRQYSDYYVKSDTEEWINNNNDAFERNLLLASFPTFVGGYNYVEHLQIPEQSKGRIIDAVARDTGKSLYIDILVATERKHRALVAAIESRKLTTLSMGCVIEFSICTKCGNVAQDDTQLCTHVRYLKGQKFLDANGVQRKIAELCGHFKIPKSVKFIEASWVEHPAFEGAVLRNFLTEQEASLLGPKIATAYGLTPSASAGAAKAARVAAYNFGQQDQGQGQGQEAPAEEPKDPLDGALSDLHTHLVDQVVKQLKEEMTPKKPQPPHSLDENQNNTLVKEASKRKIASLARKIAGSGISLGETRKLLIGYLLQEQGGWQAIKQANLTGKQVLAVSRLVDIQNGVNFAGDSKMYRTVLAVGGLSTYTDVNAYLAACRRHVGRDLYHGEMDALVAKGRLFDLGT